MNNPSKLVMCESYAYAMSATDLQDFATGINEWAKNFMENRALNHLMLSEFLKIEPRVPLVPINTMLNIFQFTSQVSKMQANQRAERETEDLNEALTRKCIECNLKFKSYEEFKTHVKEESHKKKKNEVDEAIAKEFELQFEIVRDAPKENSFYKTYQSLRANCKKDLIGIEHVIELRDYNNVNHWYIYCSLCCAPIKTKDIGFIKNHLMGLKHGLCYLKIKKPREFIRLKELSNKKKALEFEKLDFKKLFGADGVNRNPILLYMELTNEAKAAFRVKIGKILKPINLDDNLKKFKKSIKNFPLEADGFHFDDNQTDSFLELLESLKCKTTQRVILPIRSSKINEADMIDEFVREQCHSKSDNIRLNYSDEQQSSSSLFDLAQKNERMINEAIDCIMANKDISKLEKLELFNKLKYKVENAVIIQEERHEFQNEAIEVAQRASTHNESDLMQSPDATLNVKSEKIEIDVQVKPEPVERITLIKQKSEEDVNNNKIITRKKIIEVVKNVINKGDYDEADGKFLKILALELKTKGRCDYISEGDLQNLNKIHKKRLNSSNNL